MSTPDLLVAINELKTERARLLARVADIDEELGAVRSALTPQHAAPSKPCRPGSVAAAVRAELEKGEPIRTSEFCRRLGVTRASVEVWLRRGINKGHVRRLSRGVYQIVRAETGGAS